MSDHSAKGKIVCYNPWQISIAEWPNRFFVPSKSRPGLPRMVDVKLQSCDCPAGKCKKLCHHLRKANDFYCRLWIAIADRMTSSEAGWKLLRQIEGLIELKNEDRY